MGKKRTEKSTYPSRYSPGGFVTAAQYILELICERQAVKEKVDLPVRFWNLPRWKATFVRQLRKVHKLLKSYNERAIINSIKENPRIYSLLAPWFDELVEKQQAILDTQRKLDDAKEKQPEIIRSTIQSNRPKFTKPNLLDKLGEFDE